MCIWRAQDPTGPCACRLAGDMSKDDVAALAAGEARTRCHTRRTASINSSNLVQPCYRELFQNPPLWLPPFTIAIEGA